MSKTSLFRWVGLGAIALLASCSSNLDTTRVPVSASSSMPGVSSGSAKNLTDRLERSLNRYRASIGREAIPRHPGLDALAREHCAFMARNRGKFTLGSANISHYGFEERALIAQRRYHMGNCAENVAGGVIQGGDIAAELTKAWTSSSGHRQNLKGKWHATGIGVYVASDGFVYATQIFAAKGQSRVAFYDHLRDF